MMHGDGSGIGWTGEHVVREMRIAEKAATTAINWYCMSLKRELFHDRSLQKCLSREAENQILDFPESKDNVIECNAIPDSCTTKRRCSIHSICPGLTLSVGFTPNRKIFTGSVINEPGKVTRLISKSLSRNICRQKGR